MVGLELGFEHLLKKGPPGRCFVSLIPHLHPDRVIVVVDRVPGIEQIADPVSDAAKPLVAFGVVLEGLVVEPVREHVEQQPFERRALHIDSFRSGRRGHCRASMTGERHHRTGEAPVEGAGRERGHAGHLDRAVERLVVVTETLVVGAVPGLVGVV